MNKDMDMFEGLDEEIIIEPVTSSEQAKEIDKAIASSSEVDIEDIELELDDKDIASIEKKAVDDTPDMEDLDTFINEGKPAVKKSIKDSKKAVDEMQKKLNVTPPAPKVVWKGPRIVKVYGDEIYTEMDDAVTLEQIREKLVDVHMYAEFSKERTEMSIDELTGIIVPVIKFQKKG